NEDAEECLYSINHNCHSMVLNYLDNTIIPWLAMIMLWMFGVIVSFGLAIYYKFEGKSRVPIKPLVFAKDPQAIYIPNDHVYPINQINNGRFIITQALADECVKIINNLTPLTGKVIYEPFCGILKISRSISKYKPARLEAMDMNENTDIADFPIDKIMIGDVRDNR
ncbi:19769_t:CDS:2, partial [Racocetra fulgida]